MEEAFVLELFHKGNIYELPAHIKIDNNGCLIYFSLPSVDVVFKKHKRGNYKPYFSNAGGRKEIPKIDRGLIKVIASHIEAIMN